MAHVTASWTFRPPVGAPWPQDAAGTTLGAESALQVPVQSEGLTPATLASLADAIDEARKQLGEMTSLWRDAVNKEEVKILAAKAEAQAQAAKAAGSSTAAPTATGAAGSDEEEDEDQADADDEAT